MKTENRGGVTMEIYPLAGQRERILVTNWPGRLTLYTDPESRR